MCLPLCPKSSKFFSLILVPFPTGKGEIESISIEPCKRMPCHFNEGDQANLTITFTPTTPSNQIEIRSTLRTAGLINYEVQVNFDDPMICQNGDSRKDFGKIPCPIVPGETYTFVASRKFPVNTSYNVCLYSTLIILNPVQLIINT